MSTKPIPLWYVGAMPAENGRAHLDVFKSVQRFTEGEPWGGYVAVYGPYPSKATARVAALSGDVARGRS